MPTTVHEVSMHRQGEAKEGSSKIRVSFELY